MMLRARPRSRHWLLLPEQRKQLQTFAALVAIALERIHYVGIAQQAFVRTESERPRNSLLAVPSYDLRMPLTSLVGLSESLALGKSTRSAMHTELAGLLRDEARRMSNLVANPMQMARIQSGAVHLTLSGKPWKRSLEPPWAPAASTAIRNGW